MTVAGLFGRNGSISVNFNDDLNIITGRNGSGKTTLIKLAWMIMSGNILLALKEVQFKMCNIVTSDYSCTVIRTGPVHCRVELYVDGESFLLEDDEDDDGSGFGESAEDKASERLIPIGGSIFFPTFRRIEGGFSLSSDYQSSAVNRLRQSPRQESEADQAIAAVSRKLSRADHIFVSAISTQDIVGLLLKRYAALSEEISSFQADVSRSVIDKIRRFENTQGFGESADALLSETRSEIEKIEQFRQLAMSPLDAIRQLVEKLFKHSGISFGKRLSFGDAAAAISSEALSAGEKQMLSFICYNAFQRNSVIFIDEPELSLHVDWQRQLYSILSSQGSGNQFIFATHSPFIYGKYPDKEVVVGSDRGE
ncbi:AAA family ATPase [Stenotrophomonas maltophilia]|uniref:AAA family ATPase n=1 Tax=Stenotrophomonas maltophilia TaxID=40324 RepID=UPI00209AED37|nr:AAA family ATPase [Stenotrophomonas maltophilia]MCO7487342.1 ATP-binding protein [Stenotrophomonas maltophilia]